MKKKSVGFYTSLCAGILAVATLVILAIYASRGGQVTTLGFVVLGASALCEFAALFGEKVWTDFTSILGSVGLAYVLMRVVSDGVWNIAEAMNGIRMLGKPELAEMNYLLLAVNLLALVAAVVAAFQKKEKVNA